MRAPPLDESSRRRLIRLLSRTHVLLYRVSRGRLLGRLVGMPVILLTTTGRRSGRRRTVPLTVGRHGSSLVLVSSFGGSDVPPAWFVNLRAQPVAEVRHRGEAWHVRARVATPAERAHLWPLVVARYPGYARYQARTRREIGLVLLEPSSPPAT